MLNLSLAPEVPPPDVLPVEEIVAPLRAALAAGPSAVVIAPPGAGKTTRLPLALRDAPWLGGRKLIVLEPRRLAARAAAARMAATLGEQVGETVSLRVRMESRVGPRTRIEVVTEGVFARMVLDDPELAGVGCVLFDEFHERSLDADFGLALALDVQGALRDDLRLVVMSATLDGGKVARLLGGSGAPGGRSGSSHKAQASLAWKLSPVWTLQAGVLGTWAGGASWRERGIVVGVWRRFGG